MAKTKVAVIFGGVSSEHDISLISAYNVINSIPKDKYEIICIGITKKGRWLYFPGDYSEIPTGEWEKNSDCTSAVISPDSIHKGILLIENGKVSIRKVDVVFPVLHGKNGEDGTIQGLLDMSKIPYVGCGVLASASAMDKSHTHMVLDYNGIPTAKWRMITLREISKINEKCEYIASVLGYPLFVKPANCGSSIGVNKAENLKELINAVKIAFSHDNKVVIEECIKGRELEVAVFGYDNPFASFAGEVVNSGDGFYDYDSKYVSKIETKVPADLDFELMKEIREIAVKAYKVVGCKGLSRVDFFLTDKNKFIINEINTMPGFTDISMYPKLMENLGMTQQYLVEKLIEQAIENSEHSY
jgi:D-alanine-D-alanine ligase